MVGGTAQELVTGKEDQGHYNNAAKSERHSHEHGISANEPVISDYWRERVEDFKIDEVAVKVALARHKRLFGNSAFMSSTSTWFVSFLRKAHNSETTNPFKRSL